MNNTVVQVLIITVAARAFFGVDWPKNWFELAVFVFAGVVCFASLGIALSHAIPNFDCGARVRQTRSSCR